MFDFIETSLYSLLNFLVNLVKVNEVYLDASERWQVGFQQPATPISEGILNFHNDLMFFIVVIAVFVTWLLVRCISLFQNNVNKDVNSLSVRENEIQFLSKGVYHHTLLEVI